ncbi:hypothetical protein ACFU7Y_20200 [Kitasatospora sp. NPDC057542]|uniref:hypothetical protein n=1 Tax=Kitasatospora sp. NPDC057542 TaxID=3346162 RepID=UPI003683B74C
MLLVLSRLLGRPTGLRWDTVQFPTRSCDAVDQPVVLLSAVLGPCSPPSWCQGGVLRPGPALGGGRRGLLGVRPAVVSSRRPADTPTPPGTADRLLHLLRRMAATTPPTDQTDDHGDQDQESVPSIRICGSPFPGNASRYCTLPPDHTHHVHQTATGAQWPTGPTP